MAVTLDQYQSAVARFRSGLAVCSAAAGSGKTTVLVERTRQLIAEGVHPRHIAILAYNRDAAQTFRDRLRLAAGDRAHGVTVSTFHSWALNLLRAWYPGDHRFEVRRVFGADGSQIRAGDLVFPLKDEKLPNGKLKYTLAATLDQILSASDLLAESLYDLRPGAPDLNEAELHHVAELLEVTDPVPWLLFLRGLEARKVALRTVSFADLIFLVAHAMRTTPEAPHVLPLCGVYPHLMGDEAQDINEGRLTIIEHLARGTQSTLLVGDPRQAIYGFTGALPSVLQRVIQEWGAGLLTLPVNRRSTEAIVELANAVAHGQSWNLGGGCAPRPDAPRGTTPVVLACDDTHDAAKETAILAGAALARGQTVAVLARVNQDLLAVESACVALGLGVQTLGEKGGAWEGRMGAYLRGYLAACEGQITAELYDVIHLPKRFASNAALFAALKPLPRVVNPAELFAALDAATVLKDGKQVPQEGVRRFGRELRGLSVLPWSARVRRARSYVAEGIQDREKDSPRAAQDHIEALDYLADHAIELGSWQALQDYRAQVASASGERLVVLSSIHRAKGQEWDLVVGFAVNDERLPLSRSTDPDEERRLFYVLVTRARTHLVLVHDGDPSPFLDEPGIAACLSKA